MDWVVYFRRNALNRMSIPWERGVSVEAGLRGPLVRSLQRFQMGERGDGAHLKRVAESLGNPAYAEAIELFVREEQEHARLMARVLHGLGAPLLRRHWSDKCFRAICLASNLKVELTVLLVAEIIAKRYFRVLRDCTPDPVLRAVCEQILHDEEAHVAFHAHTLQRALSSLPRPAHGAVRAAWRLFFGLVCFVVVYDHRGLLRASDVSLGRFHGDCMASFDAVAWYVFGPEAAVLGREEAARHPGAVGSETPAPLV